MRFNLKIMKINNLKNLTLVLLIPTISLLIALFTIKNYGINWDEPYHYKRGQAFLHYFLTGEKNYNSIPKYKALKGTSDDSGFRNAENLFEENQKNPDPRSETYRRSYYQDDVWNGQYHIDIEKSYGHPPLNGVLAAFSNYIFYQKLGILGDIESYHLYIICTVSLMAFVVAIFIWKEFGIIESLLTSLTLATYPLLIGEQHFNIKDPVEASYYSLTMIFFYLGVKNLSKKWMFLATLFFGLALSTKFNILFSIIPMTAWLFVYYRKDLFKIIKRFWLIIAVSPLIAFGILIVSYPTIWKDPISGILEIFRFYLIAGHAQSQPASYYIAGFINTYPTTWILYTTPPIVLLIFSLSIVFIKDISKTNKFFLLVILWLVVNILRISLFSALSYGGVRLIMEFIPALSMIVGITVGYILSIRKNKLYKILVIGVIIVGFTPTIIKLVNIHPNQNTYFNFLIGGLEGAKNKNINSWGNTNGSAYYPAINWINENVPKDAKLTLPVNLIGNIPRYKLRDDIALSDTYWSGAKHNGEYVIELTYDYPPLKWYALSYLNTVMNPVYEVKVDGVAIAKVWKNDIEHMRPEFKNQVTSIQKVIVDKNTLTINLPKTTKVTQVSMNLTTKNCTAIKTGYVKSSVDNINWVREPEDIALDQIRQSKFRGIEQEFSFYFVAREAKTIVFESVNLDSCLLKGYQAKVTSLKD